MTVLRHTFSTRLTAIISPSSSCGKPIPVRITEIIYSPAMGMPAAPIEANSAVVKGGPAQIDRGTEGHHKEVEGIVSSKRCSVASAVEKAGI